MASSFLNCRRGRERLVCECHNIVRKRHRAAALHDAVAINCTPLLPRGRGVRQPYAAFSESALLSEYMRKSGANRFGPAVSLGNTPWSLPPEEKSAGRRSNESQWAVWIPCYKVSSSFDRRPAGSHQSRWSTGWLRLAHLPMDRKVRQPAAKCRDSSLAPACCW
jgi:hypothetical protein